MNDIAFFYASSLDITEEGELKSAIQVPIPSGASSSSGGTSSTEGKNGKTYFVVSTTGTNTYDAERKIQQKMSRHFFKGHRRVVFIGEALAQKGMQDILDYFSRDPGTRLRTYLVVAKGQQASELLQNDHPFEKVPTEAVRELERSGVGTAVTLRDYLMTQARGGIVPVVGAVDLASPSVNAGDNEKQPEFKLFRLSSTAVIKNYKLVGYLNDVETRSLRWIKGEAKQEYMGEKLPGLEGDIGVLLNKLKCKTKTVIKNDSAQISIELRGTGVLNESNVNLDLNQSENMALIEKKIGELIAEKTQDTVKKAQTEWKADVFGFGLQLHQFQNQTWKKVGPRWDTIFANADVTVTAKINLKRAGILTNSLENKGVGTE